MLEHEVIPVKILNFLNFGNGGEDEKQLVGLWQASGRRKKVVLMKSSVPILIGSREKQTPKKFAFIAQLLPQFSLPFPSSLTNLAHRR